MIGAEEKTALGEVCAERFEIVAPPLQFDVIALGDVVHAHVQFAAAGERASNFFAEEEIRPRAQFLGSPDGIVIGDGHQVHAEPLQFLVNFPRVIVGFPANPAQPRNRAHSRVTRVDVQIAPHIQFLSLKLLQFRDAGEKHSLIGLFFPAREVSRDTI